MPTWDDTVTAMKNRGLIRKSLDSIVLWGESSAALPTTIVSAGSLVIPTGFTALGWHSEDGLQWSREVETSTITGHGATEPLRSDTRRVNQSLEITALETNIQTLSHSLGVALAKSAGSTSELVITEPGRPKARYGRLLALSVDDTEFGEFYSAKLYSSAKVDATSPGAWSDGDNAQQHGLTFGAYRDATAGWAVRHFFGGPGFAGLRTAMGFNPGT